MKYNASVTELDNMFVHLTNVSIQKDGVSDFADLQLLLLPPPLLPLLPGWLGSRVVSVLDSGVVGPGFILQPRCCRVTFVGKLFTPVVPLFAKQRNWCNVAAHLRVARVTAGLAEGNGSLPLGL